MKRLALVAALLLVPAAAQAYLLSAGAIFQKLGAHRRSLQLSTMVVKGEMTFQGDEAAAVARALGQSEVSTLSVGVTAFYKMPGRCRVELAGVPGKEAPSASNVEGRVSTSGPAIASLKAFAAYVCPLLDGRGENEGVADLARRAGINTARVVLGRAEGSVAYVVGAHPREVGVPSIWVEKDRFEPLRLVAREGKGYSEIRLIDYSSAVSGEWHPRRVELRRGADLAASFNVDSVQPNAKLPDAIF